MHLNRRDFVEVTAGAGVGIKDIGELLRGAKPVTQ